MGRNLSREENEIPYVLPISLGGTGSTSEQELLTNLDLVLKSDVGQPNGFIPLDVNQKIDIKYIDASLSGGGDPIRVAIPSGMRPRRDYMCSISNYDYSKTYDITSPTLSIIRKDINMPWLTPCNFFIERVFQEGTHELYINGQLFLLTFAIPGSSGGGAPA